MGALGGEPDTPRKITYKIKNKEEEEALFSGGVVAISNLTLRRDGEADAIASRMASLQYDPTDAMLIAFARSLALKGFRDLDRHDCMDVVGFVVVEARNLDRRIDLRTFVKAWQDRLLDRDGKSIRPWEDLVKSSMQAPSPELKGRSVRIEWQRGIADELFTLYPDDKRRRDREWQRLANASVDSLYRRHRGE